MPLPTLAERFEDAAADLFWVPDDVEVLIGPELTWCASARPEPLYNAVVRVRVPEDRAEALVAEVSARHQGVPSRWTLFSHAANPALEAALARAGYAPREVHDVRVTDVQRAPAARGPSSCTVVRATTRAQLLDAWTVSQRCFGHAVAPPAADVLANELAHYTPADARATRFVAYAADGAAIGCGGLTLDRAAGVGFLWAGGTLEGHRGRGVYTALVDARAAHARQAGLTHVGVFAKLDTSSPILGRIGFETLGQMVLWVRTP